MLESAIDESSQQQMIDSHWAREATLLSLAQSWLCDSQLNDKD